MMTETKREKTVRRLRAFMAHKEDEMKRGNTKAADEIARQMQVLMLKHNIELAELERDRIRDDRLGWQLIYEIWRPLDDWQHCLLSAICETNGCKGGDADGRQIVFGEPADRERAKEFYLYFERLANILADKAEADFVESNPLEWQWLATDEDRRQRLKEFRQSYLLGFASSLAYRMVQLHQQAEADPQVSTALAVVDRKVSNAEKFAESEFKIVRVNETEIENKDLNAFRSGIELGHKITITTKTLNNG